MIYSKRASHGSVLRRGGLVEPLEERVLLSRALGIDVSSYQENVNWAQVKAAGYVFAWEKATQGNYYQNAYFSGNIANAKSAGVVIGAYDFGDFGVDPTTEANYFWAFAQTTYKSIKPDSLTLAPMLDVENTNSIPAGWGATQISNWVTTWCSRIISLAQSAGLSLKPVLYTYTSFATSYLNSTVTSYPLWMAAGLNGQSPQTGAPFSTAPWSSWAFWQYGEATVPGVTAGSPNDVDVFNGTAAQLQNYTVNVLGTPPTATFTTQSPTTGLGYFPFTINYSDEQAVDVSSLGSGDVTVTGPGGYSQNALFVHATPSTNGPSIVGTYQINAPGGVWNALANGIYTVKMNANQVSNTAGLFVGAGTLGTFTVNEPFAYVYNSRLLINSTPTDSSVSMSHSGSVWTITNGANTYSFGDSAFSSVAFIGTSSNDTLNMNSPLAIPLLYAGSSGQDTLNLNAGSMTFSSDLSSTTPNLTLNLNNSAQAIFSSNQHLAALNLMGSASAALAAGAAITMATPSLTITGSARLDLADDALVIDGGAATLATVQPYLTSGFNRGKWDGPGIDSSVAASSAAYSVGDNLGSNLGYSSINGVSFSTSAIVVRQTLNGDANLDGKVDADDMSLIVLAKAQQQSSSPPPALYWSNGDFNYDNKINADDFMLFTLGSAIDQQLLSNNADVINLSST